MGKSGGLWWNGARRGGRGVAGVARTSGDGNSATFELGGKTGVDIWHVTQLVPVDCTRWLWLPLSHNT
nr:hypothetical protein [Tanacetum cinerariifolium]